MSTQTALRLLLLAVKSQPFTFTLRRVSWETLRVSASVSAASAVDCQTPSLWNSRSPGALVS
jgi:hypothetical protein